MTILCKQQNKQQYTFKAECSKGTDIINEWRNIMQAEKHLS